MQKKSLTVFIGRFSPFHLGHEEVLLRALKSSGVVLLLIGSAGAARNIKNPFTYIERKSIIENWLLETSRYEKELGILYIKPVDDHPYNNQKWIAEVQKRVLEVIDEENINPNDKVYLTGAERDASTWYLQAFGSFFEKDFLQEGRIGFDNSATDIRNDLFNDGHAWEYKTPSATIVFLDRFVKTTEFKNLKEEFQFINKYKESWKAAPYAPTFVCVDACVVQSGHVLVVVRGSQPGKGLWALPGGFVEQNEKLIDASVRELVEETSIGLSPAQLYGSITDKEIFDHPDRSLRGRTITTCFLFSLKDITSLPKIKPQAGEVSKVMWLPIAIALGNNNMWYEDHHAIVETMIGRLKS
jgi:bifunctional NMN adenylyltransferase/nudix hydrolase